ncbi:MAG: tetratricopeptide repeat protein [Candidatus Euphemobacter frigidus]|nr:tetratricopeptide repeat protein [Candidatus Euphemobacter frigidus]MDP8275341.1 tetratricopeptide repeat protein [Candidatus Euphemobacter frigidus]
MRKKRNDIVLSLAIIIIAGIVVYLNSLGGEFLFDDEAVVVANPNIEKIWPLREAFAAPPRSPVRDRPVVNLTLSLNYMLGGRAPASYHLGNLLIHIISALLLFGIIKRTFESPRLAARYGLSASGLALAAALLWEVHPLQTESVAYITQRCESLMGIFYLGTLYALIRGAGSERSRWWYAAAVILCALGMGSKAVMVTAPLVVICYDRVFISRSWRELWRKRRWLYLALAATWIIQVILVLVTSYRDIKTYRLGEYALSQFGVITHYLRLSFWPHPLCLDYHWPVAGRFGEIIPPGILIGALLGLTIWGLIKKPALGFLGVWFFLILAPTSSILPLEDLAFEHRIYLPLAAIVVLFVIGGYEALRYLFPTSRRRQKIWGTILAALLVGILGYSTIRRNLDYRSAEGMWQDVIGKRPSNPRPYNNLANIALKKGEAEQAFELYQTAARLDPDYQAAHYNLANLLAGRGELTGAVAYYRRTLEINPEAVEAHNNLAVAIYRLGRKEEAVAHLREAMRIDPEDPAAYYNMGLLLFKEGQTRQSLPYLERAVELRPDHEPARRARAAARKEAAEAFGDGER